MATKKELLIEEARKLNVDPSGTVEELERKIEKAKFNIDPGVEKTTFVAEAQRVEPVKEQPKTIENPLEQAVSVPISDTKKTELDLEAFPSVDQSSLQKAVAKKNAQKYIGRPYTLIKGKTFYAPKDVIDSLKRGGFVE